MSTDADAWRGVSLTSLRHRLAQLGDAECGDFAMRVLRQAGIPEDRFDACVLVDTPAGGLYAAYSRRGLTCSLLSAVVAGRSEFEELHWQATGRRAIRTSRVPAGVHAAVHAGGDGLVRVDDTAMTGPERAVVGVVLAIPRGELRPLSWVRRDAGVTGRARCSRPWRATGCSSWCPVTGSPTTTAGPATRPTARRPGTCCARRRGSART